MKRLIAISLCMFVLGIAVTNIYDGIINKRNFDGFYLANRDKIQVNEYTNDKDSRGDWVCVNVRGMSFDRCTEVVRHECGHEMWAEICEKDSALCDEGQELLNYYSGGVK